ncbi:hypothetical protein GCK72_003298 [Caenorhabditis remanei]|uniref:F-box domain-containing protein n=1 Tax=Caenorhabditis remanei TaxID=31234 RepID=A0A6A5HYQ9_CAERE|nr:hypothetical protein GCK72_003298 [Caenorhabditis remanei]KAF1771472.1 hypothetical protein GCK72_003298 [Caenorhabditis remanei]
MNTAFRLFSLPFLPLKKVLDNFGPQGIIILSLCSQRSKSIAVSYRGPSKDVLLKLIYSHMGALSFEMTHIWKTEDIKKVGEARLPTLSNGKFRGVQFKMDGDCLVTYWEDKLTGLIEIGNYAREIFNQDISQVFIGGKYAVDYRRLIDWTMETQKTLEFFQFIEHEKTPDEDLDYILENVKCTGYLSLHATPSENFRPAKHPVFNLHEIFIHYSFWIKQEDLLAMNCKTVIMRGSKLTSRDLNVFLKHWLDGACSQLKELYVDVEEPINYEVLLDGVEFTERGDDVERVYHIDEENTKKTIRGGYDIKRPNDNIIATIRNGAEDRKRFYMFVWPDYAGNTCK